MSYQNAIIYKIECNDINIKECYIGSTVNFVGRRYDHKKINNNPKSKQYNYKVYQFIRDNGGWKNWSIKSIINYPCNSRKELILKEQEILETYDNTLNMVSAFRSKKQYYIDNAEKIKEHRAEKIQCKCGRLISRCNISTHRKNPTHKLLLGIV